MKQVATAADQTAVFDSPELTLDLSLPLVLDMDGTLLATDTLHEAVICFVKRQIWDVPKMAVWLGQGAARFKARLSPILSQTDIALFPVVKEVVSLSEAEAARGRKVVMATGADRVIADQVAERFPFISEVMASEGGVNLKGKVKAMALVERFPQGFIYAGDSSADLQVWKHATAAIVVRRAADPFLRIGAETTLARTITYGKSAGAVFLRSIRLHQWAKNALVFVPMILGGKALDILSWVQTLTGFVLISLLASATYIFNDIWDLQQDRQHWSKLRRPVASGDLPISAGMVLIAALGLTAFLGGMIIGAGTVAVLMLYLLLSLGYSLHFKRTPIVDILLLAALFTLRLALGVTLAEVSSSLWLMVFSMFAFLSLSSAKRLTEIQRMVGHGQATTPGRGYRADDAPLMLTLGIGTTVATVLIMVLYLINDVFPADLYRRPDFLWGFPVIIFLFLMRIWLTCHRGELHDDPVFYAVRDPVSLFYGGAMVALLAAAIV